MENEASTGVVEEQVIAPVEAPAVEKSMDETIRETFNSIKSRGVEAAADATDVTPKAPESDEEKAQRIRDAQGKFAKAPAEAAVPPPPPPEQSLPVAIPPELQKLGLRKEEAEAFAKASPEVQQAFQRRANEMFQGMEQYKEKAQFADTLQRTIAPHMDTINGLGVTPDIAIGALLNADRALRSGTQEQRQQYLAKIASDYQIDLKAVQAYEPAPYNPHVSALEQKVQQLEGIFQQQISQGQQREQETLNSTIAQFAADPKHSHFETVKAHMSALLQAGQAKDLPDAYEQAVWANSTTRAAVLAEQQAKARQEATQKAQAAREAASVNTRARPSMPVSLPIGSMDDTIRATLRTIQQRA